MKRRDMIEVTPKLIRCAIYTRKSTEEGLEQEFNSLDAQRESAEAFIVSQRQEGWVCLPDCYDDGGFTGGNLERPAVTRLLADIEAGKIDCVVVYKVDRLSRSLMDFSRMMQTFEKHKVSFVSVTQHFNTTHSMGRLTLNILLSFAQFEREIISERTRDKIAAARRKGKWSGGKPILGYDLLSSPAGPKLIANEDEAKRLRQIFELYLKHEALIPTVQELCKRGWTNKRYTKKNGEPSGGMPFDKGTLFNTLTNVAYLGKVKYKSEIHPGEHPAVIDQVLFDRVQKLLQRNGRSGGADVRNRYGALLKGILKCGTCQCSMGHTYSSKGQKHYRYYVCLNAQKKGWNSCESKSIPAGEIEQYVIYQIRSIGKDPKVLAETIKQAQQQSERQLDELQTERSTLSRELTRFDGEMRKLVLKPANESNVARIADLQERIDRVQSRPKDVQREIDVIERQMIDEDEVRDALARFDPVWEQLSPKEQARVIRLLVERVVYDGVSGTVSITFHPGGIKQLAEQHEVAA